MKVRGLLIVSLALFATMALFALYLADTLPENAALPVHWNAAGEVDRTMPALWALLVPVWSGLFVTLVLAATPFLEPLQHKLEGSAGLLRAVWIGMMALLVVLQLLIAGPALGLSLDITLILVPLGALLMGMGNMLPKSRPSFFVGIRTPWTLIDIDNWVATHRLGGKLMMGAGALLIGCALLPLPAAAVAGVTVAAVLVSAGVPVVYSWWFWKRRQS